MSQRVLVPLDGSALSEAALPWVRRLATDGAVEAVLLRVLVPVTNYALGVLGTAGPGPVIDPEADRAAAQDYLDRVAVGAAAVVARLVREGPPADEIIAAAAEQQVDLIAMSTHGRTGLGHLLLGSVAEAVIRRAQVPVLIVPPGARS